MVTEEMVTAGALALAKRNQAKSHEPFMSIARAVIEAALPAAEPVVFRPSYQQIKDTVQANVNRMHSAGESHLMMARWLSADLGKLYPQPAPSVAVNAAWAAKAAVLRSRGKNNTLHDINQAADYLDAAALSAQVQDVAEYEYRLVTKEGREYARLNATTDEEAQAINDNNFAGRLKVERRVVPEWEAVAAPAKQDSKNEG